MIVEKYLRDKYAECTSYLFRLVIPLSAGHHFPDQREIQVVFAFPYRRYKATYRGAFCRAMLRHHTTGWVSAMQWDSMSYKTVYLIQTILFCNRLTDNTLQAPTIISRLTTPENKRWDRLKVLVGPIL